MKCRWGPVMVDEWIVQLQYGQESEWMSDQVVRAWWWSARGWVVAIFIAYGNVRKSPTPGSLPLFKSFLYICLPRKKYLAVLPSVIPFRSDIAIVWIVLILFLSFCSIVRDSGSTLAHLRWIPFLLLSIPGHMLSAVSLPFLLIRFHVSMLGLGPFVYRHQCDSLLSVSNTRFCICVLRLSVGFSVYYPIWRVVNNCGLNHANNVRVISCAKYFGSYCVFVVLCE